MEYNIYCDESCHLLHDNRHYMIIGCTWCKKEKTKEIHSRIREIKKRNNINPDGEIKWTKISKGNEMPYMDLVNYFFDNDDIYFRAIIIDKQTLNHEAYSQTHEDWYYKMLFLLLHNILQSTDSYNIYLDYKDTQSGTRSKKLHEVLCSSEYDYQQKIIRNIQCLPSNEIGMIQLCDVLIGVLGYSKEGLNGNTGKQDLIDLVKKRSGRNLTRTTLPSERKFNLFYWRSNNGQV